MRRLWTALGLALVCAVSVRPYLWVLTVWPVSRDATIWISRGAPSFSGWHEWVFRTNHFNVGYRPLTALSYTADYLIGGFAALPYRLTDMGLHLLSAILVYFAYRRLAESLPRWGGVLAAALFAAHPVVDQVLPQLARRSYSLATAFGLGALLILCPRSTSQGAGPVQPRTWARSLLGGALLTAAVLSHEAATMTLPIVLLVVLHRSVGRPDRWRRFVAACAIPLLLVAGALSIRSGVVGGIGGYSPPAARAERVVPIALATWHTLDAAAPLNEDSARGFPPIVWLGSLLVGLYYLWRGGAGLFRGRRDEESWLLGILLTWVLGLVVLYSLLGVWFPRQVYVALAPFVLLVAVLFASTISRGSGKHWLSRAHLVPQLLLIGWISMHSPAVLGADPLRTASWRKTDAMLRGLHGALSELSVPASVGLILPHYERPRARAFRAGERQGQAPMAARQAELWMQTLLGDRDLPLQTLLIFRRQPLVPEPLPEYRRIDGRPAALLEADIVYYPLSPTLRFEEWGGRTAAWLTVSDTPGASEYVYFHDSERGRLIPLSASASTEDPG
jgi:hypothetical protein